MDVIFSRNTNNELTAKIYSHNVAKKNAPAVNYSLGTEKYRSLFQKEMVDSLKKVGITVESGDFHLKHFERDCAVCLDMPSHAPKSVSLTMVFDEHFERILRCHRKANETLMKFLEENYMITRVQQNGINRKVLSHNLLGAKFDDLYNRAKHPHLHTHNIIFNTTRNPYHDSKKKWINRIFC